MLKLDPDFTQQLPANEGLFDYIMHLDGECFREQAGRKTLRFELAGKRYFLKAHYGVGWREILKNLLQFRMPVLGARNEWRAIQRLQAMGVKTMPLVGYGERGLNPARRQSFVITEALESTISLEDFCADWAKHPPRSGARLALKRALIRHIAEISRRLHSQGINHRDYYLCHFLLPAMFAQQADSAQDLRLHLIDLHRVQIRLNTPQRWIVKDIGALYFSAMRIGLTRRDIYRFLQFYRRCSIRDALLQEKKFWRRCRQRAERLYHAFYREQPPAF